jgi:hypothetical protein
MPDVDPGDGRVVLDARDIARALSRIAHEILERNKGANDLVLLGCRSPNEWLNGLPPLKAWRCRPAPST